MTDFPDHFCPRIGNFEGVTESDKVLSAAKAYYGQLIDRGVALVSEPELIARAIAAGGTVFGDVQMNEEVLVAELQGLRTRLDGLSGEEQMDLLFTTIR